VRQQVTREDYYEAAFKILANQGHHALRMTALCKELGVTTGSFYNYFGGRETFAPALLAYGEREQTLRIYDLSVVPTDPIERMSTMRKLAIEIPHAAEAAIRAWSNGDSAVAEYQRRVDEERFEAIRAVIAEVVADSEHADLLAVMGLGILIGVQCWRTPVDPVEFERVLEEYDRTVRTSETPAHDLLDRHVARAAPKSASDGITIASRNCASESAIDSTE
jgi:AcrR family transcriptional regulator